MKQELIIVHEMAMEFVDEADRAQKKGEYNTARLFFQKALALERLVALGIPTDMRYQLTRTIFFRSAATLALDCNCYEEATQLAELALANAPHPALVEELQNIITLAQQKQQVKEQIVEITGRLIAADLSNYHIKLQADSPKRIITLEVPKDSLPDIVQRYWEKIITVAGVAQGNGMAKLQTIQQAA